MSTKRAIFSINDNVLAEFNRWVPRGYSSKIDEFFSNLLNSAPHLRPSTFAK